MNQATKNRAYGAADHFWHIVETQKCSRSGLQMNEFARLISDILVRNGVPQASILSQGHQTVPGFFRGTKRWDLAVVKRGTPDHLLAIVELKSLVSGFSKNLNNRTEEALGSADDIRRAVAAGTIPVVPAPVGERPDYHLWLGYALLTEDSDETRKARNPENAIFIIEPGFLPPRSNYSYKDRARELSTRLNSEGVYHGVWHMTSMRSSVPRPRNLTFPTPTLDGSRMIRDLVEHVKRQLGVGGMFKWL